MWEDAEKPFGLAVKALVSDERGAILALRRSAASRQFPLAWDLPGGNVEPGEAFDTALLREIREETGLHVELTGLAGSMEYEAPTARLAVLVLKARCTRDAIRLSPEHDRYVWLSPTRLASWDFRGQLGRFLADYCRRTG